MSEQKKPVAGFNPASPYASEIERLEDKASHQVFAGKTKNAAANLRLQESVWRANIEQKNYDDWYNSPEERDRRRRAAGHNTNLEGDAADAAAAGTTEAQPIEPYATADDALNAVGTVLNAVSTASGLFQGYLAFKTADAQLARLDYENAYTAEQMRVLQEQRRGEQSRVQGQIRDQVSSVLVDKVAGADEKTEKMIAAASAGEVSDDLFNLLFPTFNGDDTLKAQYKAQVTSSLHDASTRKGTEQSYADYYKAKRDRVESSSHFSVQDEVEYSRLMASAQKMEMENRILEEELKEAMFNGKMKYLAAFDDNAAAEYENMKNMSAIQYMATIDPKVMGQQAMQEVRFEMLKCFQKTRYAEGIDPELFARAANDEQALLEVQRKIKLKSTEFRNATYSGIQQLQGDGSNPFRVAAGTLINGAVTAGFKVWDGITNILQFAK